MTAAQKALAARYAAFGHTLSRVRRARDYGEREANRRGDLHSDSFYLVERGKIRPRMGKFCALAWALGVSPTALATAFVLARDCSIEHVLASSPTPFVEAHEGAARLGDAMRSVRGHRTQRQIGAAIGVPGNYVGALERGESPSPMLGTVLLLALALTPADANRTFLALVAAYANEGEQP